MKDKKNAVIIVGKYPAVGNVKTRLGVVIGMECASHFYTLYVNHIISVVNQVLEPKDIFFCYSPTHSESQIRGWLGDSCVLIPALSTDNLVANLSASFQQIFKLGYKKVIVLSTDAPDISSTILYNGFALLESSDIIMGPDNDGGYYLLGMTAYHQELFQITYNQGKGFKEQTVAIISELNKTVAFLDTLIDIDTISDLKEWYIRSSSTILPASLETIRSYVKPLIQLNG